MGFFSSASSTCGPQLVPGEMFFFGSLAFIADDSAQLADSPLQAQLLPSRGSVHFRADESGALPLQLSAHRQAPALLSVRHKTNIRVVRALTIAENRSRSSSWQSSTRWS